MFAETMNRLGNWFSSLQRYELAEECYEKSYKRNYNVALCNHGSMLADQCSKYLRLKSQQNVQSIVEGNEIDTDEAEDSLNTERLRKAEKLLLNYIELESDDSDGYEYLSSVYDNLSDYSKARDYRIIAFKHGAFYLINRILCFSESNGQLAEIAYEMFIKLLKHNDATFYTSISGEVAVNLPNDNMWKQKTLTPAQISEISGIVLNNLGIRFSNGDNGVTKSYVKAHKLFKLSLKKEYVDSYYNVAIDYLYNHGKDYRNNDRQKYFSKALKLFEIGSEKGNKGCLRELGRIYEGEKSPYSYFRVSNINIDGFTGINKDKSIEYFRLAAEKKDDESCLEMIKHLQKTEGKEIGAGKKLYYHDETSKKQMHYLFDYLKGYREEKDISIPLNVLEYMKHKINYKMKKLKKKILELELKPPDEGGRLYQEASQAFSENINSLTK